MNARVGPDGALYIADFYHGIIEHVIFMVPWLAKQIQERHLDEGNDRGRIWRVVAEDRPIDRTPPHLSTATSAELVKTLSHPNGWHRITAQRMLVERGDAVAVPALREAARNAAPLGRLHALWTLDGMDALDAGTRLAALKDPDERVRSAAVRLAEREPSPATLAALAPLVADVSDAVRLQLALTLGVFREPRAAELLETLLTQNNHPLFRTAVATGLGGRELEFLAGWLQSHGESEVTPALVALLAKCVLEESEPARIASLIDLLPNIPAAHPAARDALLAVFADARPPKPFALAGEPRALTSLTRDPKTALLAQRALSVVTWPGADAAKTLTPGAPPLSAEQQRLVDAGREVYSMICTACHQPHGGGGAGVAPPLAGSDWVSGPPERLARVVLHGLYGPIEVNGQRWNLHMPGLGASGILSDEKIAGVLSYVRRAWGNTSAPVEPSLIAGVRKETAARTFPWRAEELGFQNAAQADAGAIKPSANGELLLPARLATTYGQRLAYRPSLDILGPWRVKDDVAGWSVEVPGDGSYEVFITLAADAASAGNRFRIETEVGSTTAAVQSSGAFDRFHEFSAGRVPLRAGVNRILMRVDGPLRNELADVRALRLVPVR